MSSHKFTYPQLAFINWFASNPQNEQRLVVQNKNLDSMSDFKFYRLTDRNDAGEYQLKEVLSRYSSGDKVSDAEHYRQQLELEREMGGRLKFDISPLIKAGYIKHMNYLQHGIKPLKSVPGLELSHSNYAMILTKSGREWFTLEGKALYDKAKAKLAAKEARAARTIVVGIRQTIKGKISDELKARVPAGINLPIPTKTIFRPYGTAVVTSETDKRLYIRDFRPFEPFKRGHVAGSTINGYGAKTYISHTDVFLDYANSEIGAKLSCIDVDDVDTFDRATEQSMQAILPLLIQMNSRLVQNEAMREDYMKEAIEAYRQETPEGPKP